MMSVDERMTEHAQRCWSIKGELSNKAINEEKSPSEGRTREEATAIADDLSMCA
jgi:exo-beta-1,3-glucanase (GH17 family)